MRGGDSSGLRAYNERLIMNAVLRSGPLSKAEIGRATGLSGQAASVIVNRLLEEHLLVKQAKIRGQIGQPSTPIAPNPTGAYSIGLKIGRRSIETMLVNMLGDAVATRKSSYAAPEPDQTMAQAIVDIEDLMAVLSSVHRSRIVGLGIAMPGDLHAWSAELGLEEGALDGWRDRDVVADLQAVTGLPTTLYNDAMAACAAEMLAGNGIPYRSALYIYLGTFVGGGIVINGHLYRGESLNAGAIGSMPVGHRSNGAAPPQLIHSASVIDLERALDAAGLNPADVLAGTLDAGGLGDRAASVFEQWSEQATASLAQAIVAALSVIDFRAVVVDGLLPSAWRSQLTERLSSNISGFNRAGLSSPVISTGSVGPVARVLGAAMLPIETRFSPDTDLLVRVTGEREGTVAEARLAGREARR